MTEIIVYEDPEVAVPVQVTLEGETVWLTQDQMAELFGRERSVITKHLRNIYQEEELEPEATRAKFAQVQTEGLRTVRRVIEHYNLDAIISVGYRVNSKRGVRFRQWATSVLKSHLLHGFSLNRQRLAERGVEEAQAVVSLISGYARTWRLLLQYDEDGLALPALSSI